MFWKLFNTVSAIALATLLAGGGLVGYLLGTGKLNSGRLEIMAAVVRGELDDRSSSPPAAGQPAGNEGAAQAPRACTAEEVRELRKREHLEMLEAERAARDLEAQRRLLDQALQHVVQEQERLAEERTQFWQQREKMKSTARDEGFQRELELVSGLQPRQAKEHILRVWQKQPADAVRLLSAMDESRARRVLEQFKTSEELKIQSDLLEQIRLQGMEGNADSSGKTQGAAAP